MVQAGTIVKIQGLESAAGKQLNGSRAAVLQFVESTGRWQVRVEAESQQDATKAIKEANLKDLPRLPLPGGPRRGFADPREMENLCPKLCELLLYYKGGGPHNPRGDFQPSEIMFGGYGAMAFSRMGQGNFMYFTPVQIEQMGGVLGLANICREADEPGTESVLFALLEGNPMYVDVFIQTLHWTGCIVEDGVEVDNEDDYSIPPTMLTPDQDAAPYVKTMSEGPVLLLQQMANYKFGLALWVAMSKSEFYHLLIQRLLRFVAREALTTRDGRKLGKPARKILSSMFKDLDNGLLGRPVSKDVADYVLANAGKQLSSPSKVSVQSVSKLLKGGNE